MKVKIIAYVLVISVILHPICRLIEAILQLTN